MSDSLRKDFHTSAKEKITPDATKSTTTKLKEAVTDSADRVVRGVQPDSSKSDTQAAHDKAQRAGDRGGHGSTLDAIGDKFSNAVGGNHPHGHHHGHHHNSGL